MPLGDVGLISKMGRGVCIVHKYKIFDFWLKGAVSALVEIEWV